MNYAVKEQAQRFAAALAAGIAAITFILPLDMKHAPNSVREFVFRIALLPAAAAWLILWKIPGRQGVALFRAVMVTIALVGAGGVAMRALIAQPSPWIGEIVGTARFVPQAMVYLVIGVVGAIGSVLVRGDE